MSDTPDRRARDREDYVKEVSTVERIDSRVVITSPRQWLVVSALVVVVLFVVVWSFAIKLTERIHAYGVISGKEAQLLGIDSPVHGTVKRMLVAAGDFVREGDLLLQVLAVDRSVSQNFQVHSLRAPVTARVASVLVEAGRSVQKKQLLLRLQTPGVAPQGHIYLQLKDQQKVRSTQRSLIHLGGILTDRSLEGKVVLVSNVPRHRRKLIDLWGDGLVLPPGDVFYEVIVELNVTTPPSAREGYSWSVGDKVTLDAGMQKKFSIAVRQYSPISIIVPYFRR